MVKGTQTLPRKGVVRGAMTALATGMVLTTGLAALAWAQTAPNGSGDLGLSLGGAGQPSLGNSGFVPSTNPSPGMSSGLVDGGNAKLTALGEQAVRYLLPFLGADAPDWAKHVEVSGDVDSLNKPEWTVLTVQPLYQSEDKANTVFIQASQLRYALFGNYRDTTNVGFGYRQLLLDNTVLVGGNSFFDREWTYDHARVGFGAEARWNMLDFHANNYVVITGDRTVATNLIERAMNGWDSELRTKIPFLPWASFGVQRYDWESHYARSVKGWAYTLDMDLTPNVSMELGSRTAALPGTGTGGAASGGNLFAAVTLHLGDTSRPVAASSELISDRPFSEMQDLSNHTLDKVRRENRIIVERKNTGVGTVIMARGT
jgi:adhesin/invasin